MKIGAANDSAARIKSRMEGFVMSDDFPAGYIKKPSAMIIATCSERCTSVTGGPKAAVYR